MRIPSNQYFSVMQFALEELKDLYPSEEVKAMMYWLFEDFLEVDKTQYLLNPRKGMSESELLKFNFAIKDLKKGKPIQYILGYTYFHELKFLVNAHTLIPRPETEELVKWVYEQLQIKPQDHQEKKILDMCTGTACIPIALAEKLPQYHYYGADFKQEILDLAEENTKLHHKEISFFKFDLMSDEMTKHQEFDVIISNPPYVLESDKKQMHQNVLNFEPASALFVPDEQALIFYEKILDYAEMNLKRGGFIYFEIHEKKGLEMKNLFQKRGYDQVEIKQDFRGKDRFAKGRKNQLYFSKTNLNPK